MTNLRHEQMRCEACGSVEFYEAEFREYYEGLYSSAPGGELKAKAGLPQRVRICICGEPVIPPRQPHSDSQKIRDAAQAAKQHRAALRPEALREKLKQHLASKAEITEIRERLACLEQIQTRLAESGAKKGVP